MPVFSTSEGAALPSVQLLADWINERHAIYIRKSLREGKDPSELHVPPRANLEDADPDYFATRPDGPLTRDPVLAQFRFCNVFRELDRVTVWVRENIREPFADHPDLWFMLAVARFINWPPTLEHLIQSGYSWPSAEGFSPKDLTRALEYWKAQGNKVETGAYMIRAESDPNKPWYSWTKQRYVSEIVLGRIWEHREHITRYFRSGGRGLKETFEMLRSFPGLVGWGPFMTHQVVVDLRWTHYLRDAEDLGQWTAVGPGSMRGLNRLAGRELKTSLSQERALDEMLELSELIHSPGVLASWVPPIELADIQNCLCETDKWLRVRSGEGKPRASYVPGRGY